jgi:hypothetical protein
LTDIDPQKPLDRLTPKSGLVMVLCVAPIFFLFAYFGEPAKGRAASLFAGAFIATLWVRWELRNKLWFWVAYIGLLLLHVAAVFLIHWPSGSYPGQTLLPVFLIDLAIVYGPIRLIEKALSTRSQSGN